jgi:peptidoglycan hydrolase-like protein with peptidoglycan-binding domain
MKSASLTSAACARCFEITQPSGRFHRCTCLCPSLQVDGIFGPKTDAAVRGFQQALHQDILSVTVDDIPSVTVDGIVGPVTWRRPERGRA